MIRVLRDKRGAGRRYRVHRALLTLPLFIIQILDIPSRTVQSALWQVDLCNHQVIPCLARGVGTENHSVDSVRLVFWPVAQRCGVSRRVDTHDSRSGSH